MFCSTCGAKNETSAKFCRGCGTALAPGGVPHVGVHAGAPMAAPPNPGTVRGMHQGAVALAAPTGKSPALAAILSLFIVGIGQFYNGDTKKGVVMLVAAMVLGAATGGLLWLGLAIWSAVDAYQVASGTGKMW